ncbi:MAG TPA: response regulator [Candidatus Krumholzibacteria bacterium]
MSGFRQGQSLDDLLALNEELQRRLDEAEDALHAIREGEVDAIVVSGSKGDRVFTLEETENLHRLMVEAMNEVGIATSPEGIILYCNPRASALMQRSESELVGKPLHDFVAPQQASRIDALVSDPAASGAERVMFIASDGSAVPLQLFASPVEAYGGPVVCLVGTDLTRVEADQALLLQLREQQEVLRLRDADLTTATSRLAADLDAMSRLQRVAGLFVRGEEMQVILQEMLDTALAVSGAFSGDFQLLDFVTQEPYIAVHRGFETWRLEFWQKSLESGPACGAAWSSGQRIIIEDVPNDALFSARPDALEMHRKAGVKSVLSTPLVGRSGSVIGVLSLHFAATGRPDARTLGWIDLLARETADILGRVDTESALRRRQEELEALFSESPAAILMAHDAECTLITRNAEAMRLLGTGKGTRDVEKKLLQRAIAAREPYREAEMEITRDDGEVVSVTGGATPLFDASGAVRGAVALFNNITAHRRAQEDLQRAVVRSDQLVKALEETQRELRKSHFHLEEMVKERTLLSEERGEKLRVMANALSSAEQEERRRLAQVLHDDLQQMLVAIRLRLSNLESVVVGTTLGPTVSGINEIVDNAIAASRSLTMELSPPILRESLPRAMEWLAQWIESRHGVLVEVVTEPEIKEPSDEAKKFLFNAVRELLVNVRKHADTDRATVRIHSPGDDVAIEVRDGGKGFDPGNIPSGDHNAFGLFSIRERVEMLGGAFEIDSALGRGSVFMIRVPVLHSRAEAARVAPVETAPSASAEHSGPVRILVVDDHTIFRRGLISILESYPDLKVVGEASDGEEGVARASDLMPDVVIMDLAMPRMNGIEATRIIKSRFMSIDVLALSFQESDHARSSVLDAGASAYFTKSGPLDALLRAIRAHGGSGAEPATSGISSLAPSRPAPTSVAADASAHSPAAAATPTAHAERRPAVRRRRRA